MENWLFLLAFTLHNLEEAIWLPAWSRHGGRFHKTVAPFEFRFAAGVITLIGFVITLQFHLFGNSSNFSGWVFYGFVAMMMVNALFPHLLATIVLKRYCPGTATALLLNVPIGAYVLYPHFNGSSDGLTLMMVTLGVSAVIIPLIPLLLFVGRIPGRFQS